MTTEPEPSEIKLDEGAQLAARQLSHLEELREMAMEVARGLRDQIVTPTESENPAAARVAAAFSDVATTVRRVIALEQEVAGLREKRQTGLRATLLSDRRHAVQRGVHSAVRDAIQAEAPEMERYEVNERAEDLFRDYDDYDDADYWRGSVGEIVARICADLGVETDPTIWDDTGHSLNDIAASDDSAPPEPPNRPRRKSSRSRPTANGPPHS